MASFSDWYQKPKELKKESTDEDVFFNTIKVRIPSLKSFISWLILNKHITDSIKQRHTNAHISILSLPLETQILNLAKIKNIKDLAEDFNFKFGNFSADK